MRLEHEGRVEELTEVEVELCRNVLEYNHGCSSSDRKNGECMLEPTLRKLVRLHGLGEVGDGE